MNKLLFLIISCFVAQSSVPAMEPSSLRIAAAKHDSRQVQALLDAETSTDKPDPANHDTPLFWAIYNCDQGINDNCLQVIKLLLDHGANINQYDSTGDTPLLLAVEKGNLAIVQLLLQRSANVDQHNFFGDTPLHSVIRYRNWACGQNMAQLLIDHGADVNLKTIHGNTPLHIACHLGNFEAVKFLLKHNANISLQNNDGDTPLQVATKNSNHAIIDLLKSWRIVISGSRARMLAFCTAIHPRVGQNSPASMLSQPVLQEIGEYLRLRDLIDDHEAVEGYRRIYEQRQAQQKRQTQSRCTIS